MEKHGVLVPTIIRLGRHRISGRDHITDVLEGHVDKHGKTIGAKASYIMYSSEETSNKGETEPMGSPNKKAIHYDLRYSGRYVEAHEILRNASKVALGS